VILVTVGTNEAPFDRLLGAFASGTWSEELVVQHGPSSIRPPGARCVEYLSYEDLSREIRRARVVVGHAGVGSIMTALANGKRPIVVPRLRRYGEAVDDHQVALGRRLHDAGLVTYVEHPEDLLRATAETDGTAQGIELGPSRRLVAELREFIAARGRASA
jgi:beta-1,4-N-acetylglucosaminyltransferase